MKAMIFAAGKGTRLRPFTDNHPKALLNISGKTLLQYQIERLKKAGINDIAINVCHFAEQIINYLKENQNFGCNICISEETDLLNTGGGLKRVKQFFTTDNQPFIACNVDILSNINLTELFQKHKNTDIATLVVSERKTQRYLIFDNASRMRGWTNIATGEIRPASLQKEVSHTLLAFSGIQILSPSIFDYMDNLGDNFSLIDLYLNCCQKETVRGYIPENYEMMDVGKTEMLSQAEAFAKRIIN